MKVSKSVLAVSLALATCGAAMASAGGGGIYNTRHDFATRDNFLGTQTTSGGQLAGTRNQVGQCAFCHTPHSAQSTLLLWNKTPSQASFSWTDAQSTSGGTEFSTMAGATYKGPTAKCLACHDGSVAVGDVSMYKAKAGVTYNTFSVGQRPADINSATITKTFASSDARPQYVIGGGGIMNGTHPVGMPYPDVAGATYNGVVTGLNVVLGEFQPLATAHQVSANSLGGGLAPSTGSPVAAGGGNQASLVKLYTDTNGDGSSITGGAATGKSGMECSTCHDPHNKQTVDDWLLRGQNQGATQAGGYICLQCHIK